MIITLDPGHGKGYNTVKFKEPEKLTFSEGTRNFDYALILKRKLEKFGFTVFLTRKTVDDDPSLYERAKIAAEHKSDLLLSLHSNAKDDDPEKKGMVCVYSMADKKWNKPLAVDIADADAAVMGNGVVDVFYRESKTYPGEDYFGVLRHAARLGVKHAIIVEHGYHSNFYEAKWLSDDKNLDRLADAESATIAKYMMVYQQGDVNLDGKVDISDVTALQNILAGVAGYIENADVNGDGCIDVKDVTALLNMLSGERVMYRVQVGEYSNKENALNKCSRLLADGFSAFIEKIGVEYHVFSGSYEIEKNAEKEVAKLKEKGYDAFIVKVKV